MSRNCGSFFLLTTLLPANLQAHHAYKIIAIAAD
jgi:hypothetical protein